MQQPPAQQRAGAARRQHGGGAGLYRGQPFAAGAGQHAGIVEPGHDRQQRVDARGGLRIAARAAWRAVSANPLHDMREAGLGLPARAANLISLPRQFALVAGVRGAMPVWQPGDGTRRVGHGVGIGTLRQQPGGAGQQAQGTRSRRDRC